MADNRQFTDHNEVGGVNVYLEDKKLAESPSQSTVASTDYFVLKDTDGVPHKIVKADVLEMVRDAMGTILANNNKGTSVAKVPTIGSTGNDLGSSSVADLASVLGVLRFKTDVTGTDFLSAISLYGAGSYTVDKNAPNAPSSSHNSYVLVFATHVPFEFGAIAIDSDLGRYMYFSRPSTNSNTITWHKLAETT